MGLGSEAGQDVNQKKQLQNIATDASSPLHSY